MKKKFGILLCALLILCGCANENVTKETMKEVTEEGIEETVIEEKTEVDEIQELLDSLTLEEKVGQLFIIRPDALTTSISLEDVANAKANGIVKVTEEIKYLYSLYPVGGFAIFGKNIQSEEQLITLNNDLRSLGRIESSIWIDEEGGTVSRIANSGVIEVEKFESMEEIANSGNADRARYLGKTIGSYLKKYGFDGDFAPVADVNTNPNNTVIGARAFGSDPEVAKLMVRNVIEGLHESGILSTIKHFPGHGDTATDSHSGYAETSKTWEEMLECEMITFKEGIAAGTDMVMVAHIAAPNVTGNEEPATVSYELITGKLRNELGYEGVIITDSMAMGAITKYYSSKEAAIKAINAGCDIILMPMDYVEAFNGVKEAVLDGTISIERLNESVYRVLKMKAGIAE